MKKVPFLGLIAFVFICIISFTFSSCKDPAPPKGIVYVLDSLDQPIEGATVQLRSTGYKGAGTIKGIKVTKANGAATFDDLKFPPQPDNRDVAILDIFAYKVVKTDSLYGTGIIRLKSGETTEQKVTIR